MKLGGQKRRTPEHYLQHVSSRREFHLARPELPSLIKVAAICAALLAVGVGIIVWVSLDPQGSPWPAPAQRVMAYVIATFLIVVSIAVPPPCLEATATRA
jgi:hypothetical protein